MTFLVSVSIKLKIQRCPRRFSKEKEKKPSSKSKQYTKAKYKKTKITKMKKSNRLGVIPCQLNQTT